jgi:pimeloyl-ACP methyl ester carboxylesterase
MELAYEERGSGPVAVFVHGFPLDGTYWTGQLSGLAKVRTCVAVHLRGNGLSEDADPRDYSMDMFADDIAKTLDAIGAEKVDLVGMSMGGYILFAFWRRHRGRVRSLTFMDTKAEADTDDGKKGRDATVETARTKGLEAIWEGLKPKVFGKDPAPDVVEGAHKMFLAVPPEVAAQDSLAMRDRPDSTADLATIDVPVLWIHGSDDVLIPPAAGRAAAEKISNAKYVEVPGGHFSALEHPDEANAALADFFKSVGN